MSLRKYHLLDSVILIPAILVLFCAYPVFPYTAVLKNGKMIEGSLVREDSTQICIEDKDGVRITIRKSNMDEDATLKANANLQPPTPEEEKSQTAQPSGSATPKTLGELGRETRAKRTGKSKVLTKKDLESLPEITVMGTERTFDTSDHADPSSKEEEEAEKAWKETAKEIYADLQAAKQQYFALKQQCDELSMAAGFATDYLLQGGGTMGSPVIAQAAEVCARMQDAEAEMNAVQQEYEAFQEDARQKGILPAWVDPERF